MRGRVSREQLAFSFDEPTTAAPPYTVVCDDVLKWAETYTGPKFHAALMDGPYGLGFMGVGWDSFATPKGDNGHNRAVKFDRVNGNHNPCNAQDAVRTSARENERLQAWYTQVFKALAQHLLPGAFIMAFASSRGWHRLACAMEDAGLRIMPSIFNWRTGETHEIGMYGWANGSSFPKATRIDTKLDAAGVNYPSLHTLQEAIRNAREAKGMTRAEVSSAVCGTPSGACWNWESGLRVPTKDHWEQLQVVLNLPSSLAETRDAAEREVIGDGIYAARRPRAGDGATIHMPAASPETAPATPLAQIWAGHRYGGQVLKNSLEPIIVAQVPYAGKPVQSIVEHGSGAMWIDGGRVGTANTQRVCHEAGYGLMHGDRPRGRQDDTHGSVSGRWPSNFVLQHDPRCVAQGTRQVRGARWTDDDQRTKADGYRWASDGREEGTQHYTDANGMETIPAWACHESCVVRRLDLQAGYLHGPGYPKSAGGHARQPNQSIFTNSQGGIGQDDFGGARYGDSGTASRFFATADWSLDVAERLTQADPAFYCAKASRGERDAGLEGMPLAYYDTAVSRASQVQGLENTNGRGSLSGPHRNPHPTIKPIALCQWLATLLLPPDAYAPRRLLIPFSGSGSEGIGAMLAGWDEIVMVDSDQSYVDIAQQRLTYWSAPRGDTR